MTLNEDNSFVQNKLQYMSGSQSTNLDELLEHFFSLLPEPRPDRISSVIKYAKINDTTIKLKAIKQKALSGYSWNFEITMG